MKYEPSDILEAAVRLINRDGVGVSMAKVADEAGVSNGTLFHYFGTKQDLLDQLYEWLKSDLIAAIGDVPEDLTATEQLRTLWSVPETRTALLGQLSDAGFGREALSEMQAVVSAEDSDLYDLLAFVAYATPMVGRAVRAAQATKKAGAGLTDAQQAFVAFVLDHYVREGVDQLDADKLPSLLKLKYGSIDDATARLGPPGGIRKVFIDFQRHLYETAPLP